MKLSKRRPGYVELDPQMYDAKSGYDKAGGVRLARGLSEDARNNAALIYKWFNGLWGLCIVRGKPGAGKDLFCNYLVHKIRTYFPWKKIVRDEKPLTSFGSFDSLFNEQILAEDLKRMKAIVKDSNASIRSEQLDRAADNWTSSAGQVMLKDSVLYLTEYWRYVYNREGMSPMNRTMGAIAKMKRHLDVLILGTVQDMRDLDKHTCLPWVDWVVNCVRSTENQSGFTFFLYKVAYDARMDRLVTIGRGPVTKIPIDAARPMSDMGDGKIVVLKPDYEPESEFEHNVLYVLKQGIDNYDDLVDFLVEKEDVMREIEVRNTVKDLKFISSKQVIDYPCCWTIYNSKSAPRIDSSIGQLKE